MFSDAGGADARRRHLCQSFLATTPSLIHLCPVSLMVSFNFAALDLLSTLPVEISVVSYCWSEFTRVDLFSRDSWIIFSDDTSLHLFILHVSSHQIFRSINLFNSTSAMKRLSEDPHRKRLQPHLLLTSCVNPATDVDGIPFRRPDLFLQSLIRLCCLLNTLTFSTQLSYILSSLAWESGKTCYGEEQSPPPTCLDGHLACSGELCKYPPTTALCLSTRDLLAASDSYSRSTTSLANEPEAIGPRYESSWVWPSTLAEAAIPVINLLKSRNLQHIVSQSISVLVSMVNLKSFDGFIEVFILSLLQYHSLRKQFSVDSPDLLSFSSSSLVEDRILQSYLHSMNGDVLSDPFPSYCFSLLAGLFPCVAVCNQDYFGFSCW